MDLFLTGTDFRDGRPHNIVVEIKKSDNYKTIKIRTVKSIRTIYGCYSKTRLF